MNWKLKALIQKAIAFLPSSISYDCYYWIQRQFGNLKKIDPISRLNAGIEIWKKAKSNGFEPDNKVFFEVGTGRMPLVPIALWLMGANRIITVDLNPYLKEELIKESIKHICDNSVKIEQLFGSLLIKERFIALLTLGSRKNYSVTDLLRLCKVKYIAPCDAANTGLPDVSIDFHVSYNVFEHIPPDILRKILDEGTRLVGYKGLFIHCIDYSDHFSHSDASISKINFLRYSNGKWSFVAGNKFMYMNRFRHDDYLKLYSDANHCVVKVETTSDEATRELIVKRKLVIEGQFSNKTADVLSITGSWLITKPSERKVNASRV